MPVFFISLLSSLPFPALLSFFFAWGVVKSWWIWVIWFKVDSFQKSSPIYITQQYLKWWNSKCISECLLNRNSQTGYTTRDTVSRCRGRLHMMPVPYMYKSKTWPAASVEEREPGNEVDWECPVFAGPVFVSKKPYQIFQPCDYRAVFCINA